MVVAASSNSSTDSALVIQAQRGAAQAIEILFRRHTPWVRVLATFLMGNNPDVDDLVQDSFVRAMRALNQLKVPASFGAWLSTIVVGTAHKVFRRRQMMSRLGFVDHAPTDVGDLVSPEVAAQLPAAYEAIDRLHGDLRTVFLLRRVEGLRLDEIAAQLKMSLSTVKRRLEAAEQVMQGPSPPSRMDGLTR